MPSPSGASAADWAHCSGMSGRVLEPDHKQGSRKNGPQSISHLGTMLRRCHLASGLLVLLIYAAGTSSSVKVIFPDPYISWELNWILTF